MYRRLAQLEKVLENEMFNYFLCEEIVAKYQACKQYSRISEERRVNIIIAGLESLIVLLKKLIAT